MLFNYHTHTKRCHHAEGEDREYVEAAISAGIKTLGFSDHAPYVFPDKNFISWHRMATDELFSYTESVRALAKEYVNDIRILCGFELEYYPALHKQEMHFLRQAKPDYFILGQHFLGNEYDGAISAHGKSEAEYLRAYVTQTIEGLSTGDFLYLAHPDLHGWRCEHTIAEQEYRRLCEFAKEKNIPLEINLLGVRDNRCYPSPKFWKIAADVGVKAVLGVDAHSPAAFLNTEAKKKAFGFAQELGLQLVQSPLL